MSFAATPDEVLVLMAASGNEAADEELVRRGLRFSKEQMDWVKRNKRFFYLGSLHYDVVPQETANEKPLVDFT